MTSEQKENVTDKYFKEIGILPDGTPITNKKGRPKGILDSRPRAKRNHKTKRLLKWETFIVNEMKQDIHFTEECLYEVVRLYKIDKNMSALIITLKQIIKARDGK